jgi:hypothetical protein
MKVIYAENPDQGLELGVLYLIAHGEQASSRVGPVIVSPTPVITVYDNPENRVSRSPLRDANPFFHLMEALWMLSGRNDVALPAYYAPRIATFSDDGHTLHGAYGHRWREHFGHDQLSIIIQELVRHPDSRRCVLSMWDPGSNTDPGMNIGAPGDLHTAIRGGKDVPCNTQAYFRVREKKLDMTVTCRSNDVVWGAYGANVVHFSMLLEYVARGAGLRVGKYYHLSNNFHAYCGRPDTEKLFNAPLEIVDNIPQTFVAQTPLFWQPSDRETFDSELRRFLAGATLPIGQVTQLYASHFLRTVAQPMQEAFALYKVNDLNAAIRKLENSDVDWLVAGEEWLKRRIASRAAKTEDVRPA